MANWIWLPQDKYKDNQSCDTSYHIHRANKQFCVAQFKKQYCFSKTVERIMLTTGGDTVFCLSLNGRVIENGPVCSGGDFDCFGPTPFSYTQNYQVEVFEKTLCFEAAVQLGPTVLCDYSCGHGGFFLEGKVIFSDGTYEEIGTDSDWLCRIDRRYPNRHTYDETVENDSFVQADSDLTQRNLKPSEIPLMSEGKIFPQNGKTLRVMPKETVTAEFLFDKIYAAYICIETDGAAEVSARFFELPEQKNDEDCYTLKFSSTAKFRSMRYKSVGGIELTVKNDGDKAINISPYIIETCFPITEQGSFCCSDREIDDVYNLCRHTLRICRQTIHLDSPRHQEPLACTGDYLIETMMTAFTFGDMRLSRFDVKRTADLLVQNDGVLFHTSYSLLWIQMLWAVYEFTADDGLLKYCLPALNALLSKFNSYIGQNGLIEYAPNYMFLDWLEVDGYTLHHPPKYLGQSALCMFYYGALKTAQSIYTVCGKEQTAKEIEIKAENLKTAINNLLFDRYFGIYFDGLPTENEVPENKWLPKNRASRHFSKHSNVLAALYGVCDNGAELLRRVLSDDSLIDMQPYFMHFALDAIEKYDLFSEYGLPIIEKYKVMARECDKGLKEGWFAPKDYSFDHSHAWGGTPACQLPKAFLGFRMLSAGFRKISLRPRLFGLAFADISVPTPFGILSCKMENGKKPIVNVPDGIDFEIEY